MVALDVRRSAVGTDRGVIAAHDVTRRFGDQVVVSGLSMIVPPASIIGLIGPSGCGKTTIMRLMTGTLEPSAGEMRLNGIPPTRLTRADRRHIGYLPQQPVLFPDLTVWSNLNFHASLYGVRVRRRARLKEMLDFVELRGDRRKRVNQLSGGMQRRTALAATLVHDPRILFLDEPTAGIDPILRQRFWERFRALRDDGRTLVISTQYVGEAAYCDLVAVLANGHLVMLDAPEQIRRRAFGGEVVDISASVPPPGPLVEALARFPGVVSVHRPDACTVRVVVDSAAEFVPECLRWLERQEHVDGITCHQYVPELDDAFVRIVEEDRAASDAPDDEAS
jgi:ABC-2 type transport system ATP-binding protein